MKEHIYTIPVNEAFDKADGCPLCALFNQMEERAVEFILGDAMMQPDIRIETNRTGFCKTHLKQLYDGQKRLPLALMLKTHLDEVNKELFTKCAGVFDKTPDSAKTASSAQRIMSSCYICERIERNMALIYETVTYLYKNETSFREKMAAQPFYCLDHYRALALAASKQLSKKDAANMMKIIGQVEKDYVDSLTGDVDFFCKKFDYRYKDEPWGNAKDAVERAIKFLS
ncbi:MAG: hypothetical protein E7491_05450 [Ruminococcaceae bacterium]|nr:hypothetical protein [Oscillospiraceae bacterium]